MPTKTPLCIVQLQNRQNSAKEYIQYLKDWPVLWHACSMIAWPPVQISLHICFLKSQAHVDKYTRKPEEQKKDEKSKN